MTQSPPSDDALRIGGVVLLRADGAVLMQLRDNKPGLSAAGQWVFPGGHCEVGESNVDCARREFQEETGYDCAALEPLTEFLYTSPDTGRNYWMSFWRAKYDGTSPVHCWEGQEMRFLSRTDLARLPKPDYILAVLDLALAHGSHSRP